MAIGVVALLSNIGAIDQQALARLGSLWPLVLVLIGGELLIQRALPQPASGWLALLFGLAIGALAIAYAVYGGPSSMPLAESTAAKDASAPVGTLSHAQLKLNAAATRFSISSATLGDELYNAHFTYDRNEPAPSASVDTTSGDVSIDAHPLTTGFPFRLFGPAVPRVINIILNRQLPWEIDLTGGGFEGTGSLTDASSISKMSASIGGATLDFSLPPPKGTVPIQIDGGGLNVTLHIGSAPVKVSVNGGGNSVEAGGKTIGAIGSDSYASSSYETAEDRYDITINGGGERVRVLS